MRILLLTGMATILLSACNREKTDRDTRFTQQEAMAERLIDEVNNLVDEAATTGNLSNFKLDGSELVLASGCATVTRDTNANPKTVTIDFGTGCTGNDGRTRSGKIIATYTGPYRAPGTVITISTENYFVQGHQIIGNPLRRVENLGPNAEGQPVFQIDVNGEVIFANNSGSINWTANRQRTWTAGFNTFILADDRYSITGTANGSNSNGVQWTATITEPLIVNMAIGCRQIVSGKKVVTPSNRPERIIDYGNGQCDNTFTVTINGNTYTVIF